jgi:toxin CptA
MIRSPLFDWIVDTFEIDTMGRQGLYDYFKSVYDFSPTFRGYGIGYVTRYISILTEQKVGIFGEHSFGGMHNDIVTLYIELGFVGYSLWVWYEVRFRIMWIMKKYGVRAARILLYGTLYTFITYATDNTVFYCYINTIFMLLPLAYTVKEQEEGEG